MLLLDIDLQSIAVYRVGQAFSTISAKKTYLCSLPEVVREYIHESDHHLLLPESAYVFHTIKMEYASDEPLTISVYKKLLQEKKTLLVADYWCDPAWMTILPCIQGDFWESSIRHVLGKSWKISRIWYMYALTPETMLTLHHAYGSTLSDIHVAPRSLSLMRSLVGLLQRTSYTLLVLWDQHVSLCQIRDGWYDQLAYAPLGLHVLLEATEDQWVQKYLFRDFDELQRNSVAQKLLLDSLWFYATALAERVGWFLREGAPLVVCCPLFSHPLFAEVIQATLQARGAFVIPFATMPDGHWKKQLTNSDFCVAAYLHFPL